MPPTHETFALDQLAFASDVKKNKAGGSYVSVGYGPAKEQVHFQLGASPKDALRTPFGLDASKEEPDKRYIKLELTEPTAAFLRQFEGALLAAAGAHSAAWFKKAHEPVVLRSMLTSSLKPHSDERPDCVKLKVEADGVRATPILVGTWRDGKLVTPRAGTLHDLAPGARILPIVKVQGGVWFMNGGKSFGMSLAVAALPVVKEASASGTGPLQFEMGDVEMTDAEEDEE